MYSEVVLNFVTLILFCVAVKVRVNNEFIVEVKQHVDNKQIDNKIRVTSLDFIRNATWTENVVRIENFDHVQRITLDDNRLLVIPTLEDLPELEELSLNKNVLTKIHSAHFLLTELLKISIANNLLDTISKGVFNKELIEINLSCNFLTVVKSAWFVQPENLLILDVSNNNISSIEKGLFSRFSQLTHLNLSGNKISTIALQSLTFENIQNLDLSFNNLTELSPYIFTNHHVQIQSLNITYNELNYINSLFWDKIYEKTDPPKQISIFGNPWQCFCLRKIENQLMKYGVAQTEPQDKEWMPICVSSSVYPDSCMEVLDPELYEIYSPHVKRQKFICSRNSLVSTVLS